MPPAKQAEEDFMEILGIDIGFGFTKATNGTDTIIFKSLLRRCGRHPVLGGLRREHARPTTSR
ncbi:MAG: hypothetical protein MZU95_03365 [Desulfomicrobium escambiense]|nr:hypothetical protein [Desulfomicrobium escambiense]